MSVADLIAQLREWNGTGRVWHLVVVADYNRAAVEHALYVALLAGLVVVDVDPSNDFEEDLVVITERAL